MKISVINGPNLNLLGTREPQIYGTKSLEEINKIIQNYFPNISFSFFQSNVEGEIINQLQASSSTYDGIIINPAGYSYTSISIADTIASIKVPVIEVHLSNIYAREEFRSKSITANKCKGIISGFGYYSYILAVFAIIHLNSMESVQA
jgi:3-dehydroquinate dehydratase-2